MMSRQSQPSEDTQTLLQTYRQDHPVVRRTDVQPRQWQNVQISSLGQLVHQLKQRQRVVTPRRKCQDNTHHAGETGLGLHGQARWSTSSRLRSSNDLTLEHSASQAGQNGSASDDWKARRD